MVKEKEGLECPKCGGALIKNKATQGRQCFNCSYEIKGTKETSLFLRANGSEIIKDYQQYGLLFTKNKWGISQKAIYGIPEVVKLRANFIKFQRVSKYQIQVPPNNNHNGHLPNFPVFNDNWTSEVQLKWFGVYEKLVIGKEVFGETKPN